MIPFWLKTKFTLKSKLSDGKLSAKIFSDKKILDAFSRILDKILSVKHDIKKQALYQNIC